MVKNINWRVHFGESITSHIRASQGDDWETEFQAWVDDTLIKNDEGKLIYEMVSSSVDEDVVSSRVVIKFEISEEVLESLEDMYKRRFEELNFI